MEPNWDLSYIYTGYDDPNINKDLADIKELSAEIAELVRSDRPAVEVLERTYDLNEIISEKMEKLSLYSSLPMAVDAGNTAAALLMAKLDALMPDYSLASSALTRYIGNLDGLDDLIGASSKLQKFSFILHEAKENASHIINESAEPWMLQMRRSGGNAFSRLRDQLDSTLEVDYRGEKMSLAAVRGLAYDADASVRKEAYEAEQAAYRKIELPMSYCLNAIKLEARTLAASQGYKSVLDMTYQRNRTDAETIDAMFAAIREYLPDFRRYMQTKARILGHSNGLPFYDLFAPIGSSSHVWTAQEACDKLVREMSSFMPEMGDFIRNAFDNQWIDLYPHTGKTGGAFCAEAHFAERSLIMTNFTGSWSDVSTLVHELGHAWHNRCTDGLPYALLDIPMMLAETASIFNETMLGHQAMASAAESERFTLLESSLSDAAQVLVDIYSRYLFETEVVDTCDDHFMTVDELKAAMLRAQDASYGDGLDPEVRHPYMWACKSHYYSSGLNFYNFPYAFGQLFARGLFAIYLNEGASFAPKYCELLRSCGSAPVVQVAASAGIDVRSIDFWRRSLETYRSDIDEFCQLSKSLYGV